MHSPLRKVNPSPRIALPKSELRPEDIERLKSVCTWENPRKERAQAFGGVWGARKLPDEIITWSETRNRFYVPRGIRVDQVLGRKVEFELPHLGCYSSEWNETYQSKIHLREHQSRALYYFTDRLHDSGANLFVCPTSFGKTILMLALARVLQLKVLVIVDLKSIEAGWIKDARRFTGHSKEEIGIIRGNTNREGKLVTIASLQTLYKKVDGNPLKTFPHDLVVFDECQVVGAEEAYKVASVIDAPMVVGITATPERSDGTGFLLRALFGAPVTLSPEILKLSDKGLQKITSVRLYPTQFECSEEEKPVGTIREFRDTIRRLNSEQSLRAPARTHTPARVRNTFLERDTDTDKDKEQNSTRACASALPRAREGNQGIVFLDDPEAYSSVMSSVTPGEPKRRFRSVGHFYSFLFTEVASDTDRNKLILRKMSSVLSNPNSQILFVSRRLEQVEWFYSALAGRGIRVAKLTAKNSKNFDDIRKDCESGGVRVLCASMKCVEKGASIETINHLFFGTPVGSKPLMEQVIGRVRRKSEKSNIAVVHYFVDVRSPKLLNSFTRNALEVFRDHGFFRHKLPFRSWR